MIKITNNFVLWMILIGLLETEILAYQSCQWCIGNVKSAALQDIDQLYEDLLFNYMRNVKPVKNGTDVVEVQISAMLIQIIDIDEKSQIMTIHLFVEMHWNDYRLIWDTNNYGNTTRINIPSDQIWTPDIVLYNNADGLPQISAVTDAYAYSNGNVVWTIPQIYKSFCDIDVSYFPYDSQMCKLKFGAWTHDGDHIKIMPDHLLFGPDSVGPSSHEYQHSHLTSIVLFWAIFSPKCFFNVLTTVNVYNINKTV